MSQRTLASKLKFAMRNPKSILHIYYRSSDLWPPSNFNKKRNLFFYLIEVPLYKIAGFTAPQQRNGTLRTFFDENIFIRDWLEKSEANLDSEFFVDIGAGDGIDMSNTFELAERGWKGAAIEAGTLRFAQLSQTYKKFEKVNLARCFATPPHISDLLKGLGVPAHLTILNLDIDGYDYFVLEAILKNFEIDLLVVECNVQYSPGIFFTVNYDPDYFWSGSPLLMGASISALASLGKKYGYKLIGLQGSALFMARQTGAQYPERTEVELFNSYRSGPKKWMQSPPSSLGDILDLPISQQIEKLEKELSPYIGGYTLHRSDS